MEQEQGGQSCSLRSSHAYVVCLASKQSMFYLLDTSCIPPRTADVHNMHGVFFYNDHAYGMIANMLHVFFTCMGLCESEALQHI